MPSMNRTKAETLEILRREGCRVPTPVHFSVREWDSDRGRCLQEVLTGLKGCGGLAVRSSCHLEDREDDSKAGAFRSVLSVAPEANAIEAAVVEVIASYGEAVDAADQVLVQPMVPDVAMSGVVMTRDREDGSPYYVIEYDDESGKTDSVTGGSGIVAKTVHVFRNFRNSDFDSTRLLQVAREARKVEGILGSTRLDIEFCLDRAGTVHILQARTIGGSSRWIMDLEDEIVDKVSWVEEALAAWNAPRGGIWGGRTILGVMPDWNPAEIVGLHPRPLASSLYRSLVTAKIWSRARRSMGYREMPSADLVLLLAGRPFVDVRASFNSFLPDGVEEKDGTRLVDGWLDRLEKHPEFHDKVEFEIAQTVYDPCFEDDWRSRTPGLLDAEGFARWKGALHAMTRKLLDTSPDGSLRRSLSVVEALARRQEQRGSALPVRPAALLARASELLDEAREEGTLPFAVVARHAFVAEAFLRGAVRRGALGADEVQQFRSGVRTVTSRFGEDCTRVRKGELDSSVFLERYGHLRPGTYDILSPRYADAPEAILSGAVPDSAPGMHGDFQSGPGLDRLLREMDMPLDGASFLEYARMAIAGREYAKFVFTRSLSDALECIARWGEASGTTREELSWLSVDEILGMLVEPPLAPVRDVILPLVEQARRMERIGHGLKLGYLIRSPRDVYVMPRHRSAPNFVTRKVARGPVVHLDGRDFSVPDLNGAVVCIRNADPGFDWLFARGIAALVTQFGGTNSHMAIRCTEYGIPAAIGCGEQLFESIRCARSCELDAGANSIIPLETP